MIQQHLKRWGAVAAAAVMALSCAGPGTDLKRTHFDKAFVQTPVSDILVIAVAHRDDRRRLFEERFVAALEAAGVDAVASADAIQIPSDLALEKEQILQAVDRHGSDAVIVTHLADIDHSGAISRAPASMGYYGYYGFLFTSYRDPGYSTEQTTVWLETNLYDVATESLIWAAESKSWNAASDRQVIKDIVGAVVQDLIDSGAVAPK